MNSFVFGTINTYGMLHFDVVCCGQFKSKADFN